MKILHINTTDKGGAAKACIRLHKSLMEINSDSRLLLFNKTNENIKNSFQFGFHYKTITPKPLVKRIKEKIKRDILHTNEKIISHADHLKGRSDYLEPFSNSKTDWDITKELIYHESEIINLHWTSRFLDYNSFFKDNKKKVVWTLHDTFPFCGGCHYPGDCKGFLENCKKCPQLENTIDVSYSGIQHKNKMEALHDFENLTIVSPSKWLLNLSKASSLFRKYKHLHIPYGIDTQIFQPRDKFFSRTLLGIPIDKKVILFVADSLNNYRKGYNILVNAFKILPKSNEYLLCSIGSSSNVNEINNIIELGRFDDELMLSIAYSAADLYVIPSLEDNLPSTVIESLSCGTPVIGFSVGGMTDMIIDDENGILVKELNADALSDSIEYFFQNIELFNKQKIRKTALYTYEFHIQAEKYSNLYSKL